MVVANRSAARLRRIGETPSVVRRAHESSATERRTTRVPPSTLTCSTLPPYGAMKELTFVYRTFLRRRATPMAELVGLAEGIASLVHDGDTVALEGFTHLIPVRAGQE